jgi:phage terminase Nu1 subunit (DNA packaging protein)
MALKKEAVVEFTPTQLSLMTGKSYRTISAKLQKIKPCRQDKNAYYYKAKDALEAIYVSEETSDYDKDENLLMKEKLKHEKAKAEKAHIEVEILRGETLMADVVEKVWTKMSSAFRAKTLSVPTKVSLELLGEKDIKKIEEKIKGAIYEALDELKEFNLEQYVKETNRESGADVSAAAETNDKRVGGRRATA